MLGPNRPNCADVCAVRELYRPGGPIVGLKRWADADVQIERKPLTSNGLLTELDLSGKAFSFPRCKMALRAATIRATMTSMSCQAEAKRSQGMQPIDWQAALARHNHWLRTVVFARLGNLEEVDEVMQEVSLAAVEQKAPLVDPSKVAPWLYQVAVRQSLMFRRKRGRQRKLTDRYAEYRQAVPLDSAPPDPLAWLLADERRRLVREAMNRLPRRDREILLLKYTENWTYHQLADHLGISHSAVEARLFRARRRMRAQLLAAGMAEVKQSK